MKMSQQKEMTIKYQLNVNFSAINFYDAQSIRHKKNKTNFKVASYKLVKLNRESKQIIDTNKQLIT